MQDLHDFISNQTPHSHLIYSLRSAFPRFALILVAPLEITVGKNSLKKQRWIYGQELGF